MWYLCRVWVVGGARLPGVAGGPRSGRWGGVRGSPHTHLPQRPWQAAELVGCVDGHHGHGGHGDGPSQHVGPLREDVVSVVRGPEGHHADHDHKLKPRAQVRQTPPPAPPSLQPLGGPWRGLPGCLPVPGLPPVTAGPAGWEEGRALGVLVPAQLTGSLLGPGLDLDQPSGTTCPDPAS